MVLEFSSIYHVCCRIYRLLVCTCFCHCSLMQGSSIPFNNSSHKIQEYPAGWDQTLQFTMGKVDIKLLPSICKNALSRLQ